MSTQKKTSVEPDANCCSSLLKKRWHLKVYHTVNLKKSFHTTRRQMCGCVFFLKVTSIFLYVALLITPVPYCRLHFSWALGDIYVLCGASRFKLQKSKLCKSGWWVCPISDSSSGGHSFYAHHPILEKTEGEKATR